MKNGRINIKVNQGFKLLSKDHHLEVVETYEWKPVSDLDKSVQLYQILTFNHLYVLHHLLQKLFWL